MCFSRFNGQVWSCFIVGQHRYHQHRPTTRTIHTTSDVMGHPWHHSLPLHIRGTKPLSSLANTTKKSWQQSSLWQDHCCYQRKTLCLANLNSTANHGMLMRKMGKKLSKYLSKTIMIIICCYCFHIHWHGCVMRGKSFNCTLNYY